MPSTSHPPHESLRKELQRKAFHLLCLLFLGAYLLIGHPLILRVMGAWLALIFIVETARLRSEWARRWVESVFKPILRSKESRRYTGAFYTSLGAFCCFLFFGEHPTVIKACLCYLAFGDSASAVAGRMWGRHTFTIMGETRSLEGSAAGLSAAVLCGLALGLPPSGVAAGTAAFVFADTVPLPPDDNFWIPVLTGTALYLVGI